MLKFFNTSISLIISYIPRPITWLIAKRYVAGTTIRQAINITSELNKKGYEVTLDILGEHTRDKETSLDVTKQYCHILNKISSNGLKCNISVKPTHIGLDINETLFQENLQVLIKQSQKNNIFLRLDMEDSKTTDKTLKSIYTSFNETNSSIGTVIQAYLHRSIDDIKNIKEGMNFRICKGIYKESSEIAIQDRKQINANFMKILRKIFNQKGYAAIATHDTSLIEECYKLIEELKIDTTQFEFQSLYGVPMQGYLEEHQKRGYKIRIYVPFGLDWYKYSIRRLKENPNIISYVLKNLFK